VTGDYSSDYSRAIASLTAADPVLGELIDQVGACRLDQVQLEGDLLFALCRSIISQQLSTKAAKTIHQRFLAHYGAKLTAKKILNTEDEDLRAVGLSRQKIGYIKDLAQKVQTDLPDLTTLADWEDEAIIATLTQVKGIGKWTVQMLLIFRLHRWDVLPVDDLGIRMGVQRVYHLAALPTPKQVAQLGEKWQPYRAIASWYLWRSLELP
jgi:DNA-3-methyladenine glycosylase II